MASPTTTTTTTTTTPVPSRFTKFGKYKLVSFISIGCCVCAAIVHRGNAIVMSSPMFSPYEPHIRAAFSGIFDVGKLSIMISAATLFAGTVLWIPFSRFRTAVRAELKQRISDEAAADAAFETACLTEYDLMMASGCSPRDASLKSVDPIAVDTPRGKLVMTYVPGKTAFGYYTDRKDSLAYTHLETAARMFLVKNERPDLAALAYADRRVAAAAAAVPSTPAAHTSPPPPTPEPTASGGVFALFRKYNRKPAAPAASSSTESGVVDTHFVYLGTMHDYEEACAPKSPSTGEYANIDYAEFKKKTKSE
jgi:hypothetical protein